MIATCIACYDHFRLFTLPKSITSPLDLFLPPMIAEADHVPHLRWRQQSPCVEVRVRCIGPGSPLDLSHKDALPLTVETKEPPLEAGGRRRQSDEVPTNDTIAVLPCIRIPRFEDQGNIASSKPLKERGQWLVVYWRCPEVSSSLQNALAIPLSVSATQSDLRASAAEWRFVCVCVQATMKEWRRMRRWPCPRWQRMR